MELAIKLYLYLVAALLTGVIVLHSLPRLGKLGKNLVEFCCFAPGIDLVLAYFMLLPIAIGTLVNGWRGAGVALLSELSVLWMWIIAHEFVNRHNVNRGKIARTMSGIFGGWRNHLAIWITALAIPVFWFVRFAEAIVYPPLTVLINLPKYQARDWVNVSRHKFEGLIGYDLIWCLYCDWMTGVWSLGTEMLRNVESFWCPIRFYSDKKCENCKQDFPDLELGWIAADGNMEQVSELLQDKYSSEGESAWFGHSNRQNSANANSQEK